MDAKICDRCGEIYNVITFKPENVFESIATSISQGANTLDLCPDCTDKFKKWLKGKSNE